MIDERTSEQASLYVLDLLDDRGRAEFEAAMAASAELRDRVRELADSLHEPLKRSACEARPDLLEGIHRRIGLPVTGAGGRTVRRPAVMPWSVIWAVAAALMLAMNLSLLMVMARRDALQLDAGMASAPSVQPQAASAGAGPGSPVSATASRAELLARVTRLEQQVRDQQAELAARDTARKTLEAQKQEAITDIEQWEREYMRLAARFLPFFESKEGLSRFTVIEMVDSGTFDNNLPRRGFADLAGQFLSGEGNIAGTGGGEFVGPVAAAGGDPAAAAAPPASLAAVARGTAGLPGTTPADPADAASTGPADVASTGSGPTGFTVWRDDEQKGFLDLYGLPDAGAGRDAFLWVRSSEVEPYVPVGYLPPLENGTGSLFYSVDEPDFTPVEILITAEDAAQPGQQPSDEVLLRGP